MKTVSVIIATYNPILERVLFTVDSVIKQIGIDFELIITDDGSKENYFDEIEKYIRDNSSCDYLLLSHNKNQGTLKNILDAVDHSSGKYIRTVGAGDAIIGTETLKNHVHFLEESGRKWSFGQMIYFSVDENGNRYFIRHKARPQITKPYLKNDDKKCVWLFCVSKDIATGTAVLYEKEIMKEYLLLLEAVTPDGEVIATGIYATNDKSACSFSSGSYRAYSQFCANELIRWEAFKRCKARGATFFNNNGCMDFKLKFGALRDYRPRIVFSRHKWLFPLRKFFKNLWQKIRFTVYKILRRS